jgi:3-(3-hydroxy-phenyl)propionate hydroxylase
MRNSSDIGAAHKSTVSNHKAHYSVVIVGAGPTGLTLANLLGAYGVDVLLIERNPATVAEPRAVSIDDESLRTMQAAGLIDAVLPEIVAGYGSEYFSRRGRMFLKVQPTDQPYGYARRNAFRQPILENQLRQGLNRYSNVTTLFSCSLRSFTETPGSVRAELQGDVSSIVECDYLVGCDGASSNVRTQLGIELKGKTFAEPWLILDLENAAVPNRNTFVCCDPARPYIALPGPNQTRRFEFKLHPYEKAEDMLRPEVVSELLTRGGTSPDSRLTRTCVYRFHARVADKWSSRRVFLAGDAAHLTPPFAGQGMNSGVRDAHNLAWKLAYVVAGRLGPRLLDTMK